MPERASRPCTGRGPRRGWCPNLRKANEPCCDECKPFEKKAQRKYDKKRDESPERQFLHSTPWRAITKRKLAKDPLCERCLKNGHTEPAVLTHHIDHNELNNDPDNHESLCKPCHLLEHKGERWGR